MLKVTGRNLIFPIVNDDCIPLGSLTAETSTFTISEDVIDVTCWGDAYPRYISAGREGCLTTNMLVFGDLQHMENWLHDNLMSNNLGRHLGPSATCEYCSTAWLPGTFSCPSCGGTTRINYDSIGWVTSAKLIYYSIKINSFDSVAVEVEWRIADPVVYKDWEDTIRRLLISHPDIWVCQFCGHVVYGKDTLCPGCGGNRLPAKELAIMKRICIYCGEVVYGGYACKKCNVRLKAWK